MSFAGNAQGVEARLAVAHGLEFHSIPARPLRGRGLGERLLALWLVATSTLRSRRLIKSLGVDAVVATGGYVCVAAGLAARLCRLPLVLVEPNAVPGLANKLLGRFATAAAVAWESTIAALPCPAEVTGVPVRSRFFTAAGRPFEPPWRILVLGGSQGAESLNLGLPPVFERLRRDGGPALSVLHQAGAGKETAAAAAWAATEVEAEVVTFIDDVAAAMADAHLGVSRAGAVTLAEICAAGRPSILAPLHLAGGHQADNARALERAGAARVLEPGQLDAEELRLLLLDVLDGPRLEAMAAAARSLAHPDAASRIVDIVEGAS